MLCLSTLCPAFVRRNGEMREAMGLISVQTIPSGLIAPEETLGRSE
jgi:hypothetical protein